MSQCRAQCCTQTVVQQAVTQAPPRLFEPETVTLAPDVAQDTLDWLQSEPGFGERPDPEEQDAQDVPSQSEAESVEWCNESESAGGSDPEETPRCNTEELGLSRGDVEMLEFLFGSDEHGHAEAERWLGAEVPFFQRHPDLHPGRISKKQAKRLWEETVETQAPEPKKPKPRLELSLAHGYWERGVGQFEPLVLPQRPLERGELRGLLRQHLKREDVVAFQNEEKKRGRARFTAHVKRRYLAAFLCQRDPDTLPLKQK